MRALPQQLHNLRQYFQWYYFTRGVGAVTAIYELLLDHSSERGTIIVAAFGLMGLDWVTGRDPKKLAHKDEILEEAENAEMRKHNDQHHNAHR